MLSKKVKLSLDYKQEIVLETLSNEHRLLYNFLLEKVKYNLDFKQINENYKTFRVANSLTINSKSAQNTAICLINNIKSYLSLRQQDFQVNLKAINISLHLCWIIIRVVVALPSTTTHYH